MENNLPPRRKATPKLKMPIFGEMIPSGTGYEGDINRRAFMYLIGFMVLFMVGFEYYSSKKSNKIVKASASIQKLAWKGKVTKKYMGYDKPDIRMFDFRDSTKSIKQVDISADSSTFFGLLMPRDSIFKAKNSLNVRIKNYKRDTTITLQFSN